MILARDKYGRIGRQVPGVGMGARVAPASEGERRGNVNVSTAQIESDHAYWTQKENEARALQRAERIARTVREQARAIAEQKRAQAATQFQRLAKVDPMNEQLRNYFAKRGMMGETAKTADAILASPADFSSQGGNVEIVEAEKITGGDQWAADWRQHRIVGNPLTRDGVYGPGITDFDRIARGVDVNQLDKVQMAGGTMLGRFEGRTLPSQMGFDWSWDGITDSISNVASQTVDQTLNKLPDQLSKELQNLVSGGGGSVTTNPATGTVYVQQPTTVASVTAGVPKWALYTGLGMLGLGLTFVLIKAVKK